MRKQIILLGAVIFFSIGMRLKAQGSYINNSTSTQYADFKIVPDSTHQGSATVGGPATFYGTVGFGGTASAGTIVYVKAPTCTSNDDGDMIQAAIDSLSPVGGTVVIPAGTYCLKSAIARLTGTDMESLLPSTF